MGVPGAKWHVSDAGLEGLKNYKYHGTDLSLTSRFVMQRYWRWAVEFLPRTLAPNLVTLCGFGCLLLSYVVTAAYCPTLRETGPWWVWALNAACLFAYQTLDALDGKQARRTGTSSPLGELFDHGCDALGTHLIGLNVVAALRLNESEAVWASAYVLLLSTGFYFCAWEQYHTGTLTLGYINGPVEGLLTVCGVFVATAVFGQEVWQTPVYGNEPLWKALLLMTNGFGALTLGANVLHVLQKRLKSPEQYAVMSSPTATLLPDLVMLASVAALQYNQPVFMANEGLRTVPCAYGLAVANSCGRFVLSRVCCVLTELHPGLELPVVGFPIIAAVYSLGPLVLSGDAAEALEATLPLAMEVYMYILAALYLHMSFSVCDRISKAVGINVLTMTEQQVKNALKAN